MKSGALFYILRDGHEAGPYDLVQMAGLLRQNIITSETPTRGSHESDWTPFCEQPPYTVVLEMPAGLHSAQVEAAEEAAENARSPIPFPSMETILLGVGMVFAGLIIGLLTYLVAWADTPAAIALAVLGTALALIGTCMMYVRMVDESGLVLLMIYFVPFYDIYYYLTHFWEYFPSFCAKYVGGIMVAAAFAGIATSHSPGAEQVRSFLHLYGQ